MVLLRRVARIYFWPATRERRERITQIGVHSWSGLIKQATDFPVGHKYHQPYISYYISVGFSKADSEKFYYFTINSAPSDSVHYMTDEEITEYKNP